MTTRLVALTFAALVATNAFADSKAEIGASYTKFNNALKAKDLKTIGGMLAKDFTWKDKSGTENKTQALAKLKKQLNLPFTVKKIEHTMGGFSEKGNTASVKSKTVMTATFTNPNTKKTSTIVSTSESTDTWQKSGNTWLLKGVVEGKNTTTLDGKSISG
ncbi:MAG: nuclear transport factor 2 family protein [Fimbriimonadaceae bacterium]